VRAESRRCRVRAGPGRRGSGRGRGSGPPGRVRRSCWRARAVGVPSQGERCLRSAWKLARRDRPRVTPTGRPGALGIRERGGPYKAKRSFSNVFEGSACKRLHKFQEIVKEENHILYVSAQNFVVRKVNVLQQLNTKNPTRFQLIFLVSYFRLYSEK